MLECKLNRYYGHFEGDAQTYRPKDEVKNLRETKDCLVKFWNKVTSDGKIDASEKARTMTLCWPIVLSAFFGKARETERT